MFSQTHYLIRSKTDGRYLVARLQGENDQEIAYILLFKEHYDALSYLNTHGAKVADQFGVESVISSQLNTILQRWGYQGIGVVEEPLEPRIQFLLK
ncbi:MAG: hypothetical protein AB4041_22215 [Microcystaceae cyanobacterium]